MQRKTEEGATILVCTRLDFTLERIMASVDARRQVCNIYEKASCFFLLFLYPSSPLSNWKVSRILKA